MLAVALMGCTDHGGERPSVERVVLISLDTLRADMLGAYGYDALPTSPVIDAFAREGILFESSYTTEPWTLTSHMSLFTGLYPQNHGVTEATLLAPETATLAELLRERGLRTQAFAGGGYVHGSWGFDRGFEGYVDSNLRGLEVALPRALQWLRQNGDQPFFLFLHTYDVHSKGPAPFYRTHPPYYRMFSAEVESDLNVFDEDEFRRRVEASSGALSPEDRRYIKATYAEGIRYVDSKLGELFTFMRRRGLYDDALIILWSDHGEGLYDHVTASHGEVYTHTIRVPLIIRLPGGEKAGLRIATPVSSVDLAPTILSLVGARTPRMDGESLLELIEGEEQDRVAYAYRTKRGARLYSVSGPRHHYFWDARTDRRHFFDRSADPGERRNLAGKQLAAEEQMHRLVTRWIEEHGDGVW